MNAVRRWREPLLALAVAIPACTTAGSAWMEEPLPNAEQQFGELEKEANPPGAVAGQKPGPPRPPAASRTVVLGEAPAPESEPRASASGAPIAAKVEAKTLEGKVLGTFRNTYYDFPSERDFQGAPVALKNARCETIKEVPTGFYESVCVQGSGTLASGVTVSFNKRDCKCAPVCPRTSQNICFDQLDPKDYPWGRGATGKAITPLLTVAVDSSVIPLDTPIYIPEYDGAVRDGDGSSTHDGCFIAQDRGLRIKGNHVDIFTGHQGTTELWNKIVPSNKGVTVVLESPRCARANPS